MHAGFVENGAFNAKGGRIVEKRGSDSIIPMHGYDDELSKFCDDFVVGGGRRNMSTDSAASTTVVAAARSGAKSATPIKQYLNSSVRYGSRAYTIFTDPTLVDWPTTRKS